MATTRPTPPAGQPTLYEWAGGKAAFEQLTTAFYRHVKQDDLLAPVFEHMSNDHPARVAEWLGEVFGGPATYTQQRGGHAHMITMHLNKSLTEKQRARWVQLMLEAADEVGLPADTPFRQAFAAYLEWGTGLALAFSQPGATPPLDLPVPIWNWDTTSLPLRNVPASPSPIQAPASSEQLGFEQDIKALFRPKDRQSMRWAFDLWSYQDVSAHADAILQRLVSGTMPCDGAWTSTQVELFRRWIEAGKQP